MSSWQIWASIALSAALVCFTGVLAWFTKALAAEQKHSSQLYRQMIEEQGHQVSAVKSLTGVLEIASQQAKATREDESDSLRRVLVVELLKNYYAARHTPHGEDRTFHNDVWLHVRFHPITDAETWGRLTYLYDVLIPEAMAHPATETVYSIPKYHLGETENPAISIGNMLGSGNNGLLKIFHERYGISEALPKRP